MGDDPYPTFIIIRSLSLPSDAAPVRFVQTYCVR
jgi:hypothetical protein